MLINFDNEPEKITLTLIFEDKESQISWNPKDTSLEDAKFMFMCSCDALVDGEFEILDMQAKPIDLKELTEFKNKSVFYLRKKATNKATNLLIDGRRKLFVEIEPLRHIEAQVALKYMCIGSNLLKHTKKGFPHIRLFQLSADLKRILWYTKSKTIDEAQVSFDTIKDLTIGQISESFMKYPLKMLEDYSFSIYYKTKDDDEIKTLDLTCKNQKEFDLWVIGIKALHAHYNGKVISKNDLLSHSKSYNEQVKKGNIGHCTKFLFYDDKTATSDISTKKGEKSLEEFLSNRNLTPFALCKVILKLCNKIDKLRIDIDDLSSKDVVDSNKNKITEEGYEEIFNEEAIVDDLETQKSQMINLFNKCEKELTICIYEYFLWTDANANNTQAQVPLENKDEYGNIMVQIKFHYDSFLPSKEIKLDVDEEKENEKIMSEFFLKELDIKTWKIEVDLENVGDIINRFKCLNNKGFIDKLKGLFKGLI